MHGTSGTPFAPFVTGADTQGHEGNCPSAKNIVVQPWRGWSRAHLTCHPSVARPCYPHHLFSLNDLHQCPDPYSFLATVLVCYSRVRPFGHKGQWQNKSLVCIYQPPLSCSCAICTWTVINAQRVGPVCLVWASLLAETLVVEATIELAIRCGSRKVYFMSDSKNVIDAIINVSTDPP